MAEINSITAAANGGLALVGGWYVYVTLPYVYVAPIIELGGSCSLRLNPILSYGGPGECNYDNDKKTCDSDKTIEDTMGDQGRALHVVLRGLSDRSHMRPMAEAEVASQTESGPSAGSLHGVGERAARAVTPWGVV